MDCCNYMQYRHHQYYGSQYYEPVPQYHGDFYGQQVYQEYYGNAPYYQQTWPSAAAFPDYVYNPKEARIRKAMRDATRERSIGTSPLLARPNARRVSSSHGWIQPPPPPPHDDLMMRPMANMQPPVCAFPMSSSTSEQFMGAMNYDKLEQAPPSTASVHSNYMQSDPLTQLQQQAEMWPEYQTMRPRSSGNPFMMGEPPSYPRENPEMNASLMMEKQPTPATPPPTEEVEPSKEQEERFIPVFEQSDENKMKKHPGDIIHLPLSSQSFRASPGFFSNDIKYQNNYILEYFQSMPEMTIMNITTPNGTTFPYATYTPTNFADHIKNETQVFENITEPIFFHTDVGFVPMSAL